tara:strand:+ start:6586 stop:6891 length:306 start_codon:yes stop_codon:yes gene_type:complete
MDFLKVWRGLTAMNLVHQAIGSTDFEYWQHSLKDFPSDALFSGLKKAEDWTGFMGLGDFRGLCRKEKRHASHNEFLRIESAPLSGVENQSRIRSMKESLGL